MARPRTGDPLIGPPSNASIVRREGSAQRLHRMFALAMPMIRRKGVLLGAFYEKFAIRIVAEASILETPNWFIHPGGENGNPGVTVIGLKN